MNEYRFDLSNFTIADAMQVQNNAQRGDVYGVLLIANRFIPINLFALPISEINTVLSCFCEAIKSPTAGYRVNDSDYVDQLIQKALEN